MQLESGTITATGAGSAVSQDLDGYGPASMGVVSVSGTFTSAVVVVEKKLRGGAVWLPLNMQNEKTLVRTDGTASPSDSATTSWRVDLGGAGSWRAYVSSGTPTDVDVELASGAVEEFGGILPAVYTTSTAATTFGAGVTFSGATGANDINLTDNLASALDITESTNSYLNFVTTNSGERVVVGKQMKFADSVKLSLGDADDITVAWDGTDLDVLQAAPNSSISWGIDGAGIDQIWYGDTASAKVTWDQSADQLVFGGVASVSGLRVATSGATAITTTRAVTKADSGGVFTVAQGSAYTVTVATPAGAGERYIFQCVSPGAFDVSIVATACTFEGTITIDGATIVATGSTLKFASGAAALGDNIELISTSTSKFLVRAIGSAAGGITIA